MNSATQLCGLSDLFACPKMKKKKGLQMIQIKLVCFFSGSSFWAGEKVGKAGKVNAAQACVAI